MNAGMMIGLVVNSIVAMIMVVIGICQVFKKDGPTGFYSLLDLPKANEITDITLWNKKHGIMWILYGICIEAGFMMSLCVNSVLLKLLLMMGGVFIPLPFMIFRHHQLEKMYKISK